MQYSRTRAKGTVQRYETVSGSRFPALGLKDGKRKSVGTFKSEEEALEALQRFYDLPKEEDDGPPNYPCLMTWAPTWVERRKADGQHRSMKDVEGCVRYRVLSHSIARVPFASLTPKMLKQWVRDQMSRPTKRGPRPRRQTVVNSLNVLRVLLKDAVDEELFTNNPAVGIRVPREVRTDDTWTTLTLDELRSMLAAKCLSVSNRNTLSFAAFTGLRAGEVYGLRWKDVDLEQRIATIRFSFDGPTKAGKVRRVPLVDPAVEALISQRDLKLSGDLVFPAIKGRMRKKGDKAGLTKACAEAGIQRNVRLHDLRHGYASYLVSGALGRAFSLPEVQSLLGHASPSTTNRYAHMSPEAVTSAVHSLDFSL